MINFIMGCVAGFVIASVGLTNVVNIVDTNLTKAKESIEAHK